MEKPLLIGGDLRDVKFYRKDESLWKLPKQKTLFFLEGFDVEGVCDSKLIKLESKSQNPLGFSSSTIKCPCETCLLEFSSSFQKLQEVFVVVVLRCLSSNLSFSSVKSNYGTVAT